MRGARVTARSDEWPTCYQQIPETGLYGTHVQRQVESLTCIPSGERLGGCKTTPVLCHALSLKC